MMVLVVPYAYMWSLVVARLAAECLVDGCHGWDCRIVYCSTTGQFVLASTPILYAVFLVHEVFNFIVT